MKTLTMTQAARWLINNYVSKFKMIDFLSPHIAIFIPWFVQLLVESINANSIFFNELINLAQDKHHFCFIFVHWKMNAALGLK